MKFQKIITILLSLLLVVNTVGIGLILKEEKKQTENALYATILAETSQASIGDYSYYQNLLALQRLREKNYDLFIEIDSEIHHDILHTFNEYEERLQEEDRE